MKVLIADDDLIPRTVLQATLARWGYEVVVAADGGEALRRLTGPDAPRLAVLDWEMPGADGPDVCRQLRQRVGEEYPYLILLTNRDDPADLVRGLEAGADDYLIKPVDPAELRARLQVGRRILSLQQELIAAREALRQQALRDALTGAWNRRAILDALAQELHRAGREGRSVGLALVDVDNFKAINDTHGHLIGDAVLEEAVRRMQAAVRPYDVVGRYGGEEFLLVLPGCDAAAALGLAERVRARLAADAVDTAGHHIRVTASLGVTAHHGPPADVSALLTAADAGLYRAKRGGRDRVEFEPSPSVPSAIDNSAIRKR